MAPEGKSAKLQKGVERQKSTVVDREQIMGQKTNKKPRMVTKKAKKL